MKKIISLILIILSFLLFSCNNVSNIDNSTTNIIRFDIDDITININDYNDNYNFSNYVRVYNNDNLINYEELNINRLGNIQEGLCKFEVEYLGQRNEFIVNFIENFYNVSINYGNRIQKYQIKENDTLANQNLSNKYTVNNETMSIEGYYLDKEYKYKYDINNRITSELNLYANLEYDFSYIRNSIDSDIIYNTLNTYIDELMNSTDSYIPSWNKESFKGKWNYIDGVFLNSIINLFYETNNNKYKDFYLNYIDYYINENGEFIDPRTNDLAYNSKELDSVCESRILFDAYEMTKDIRYLNAINNTYNSLMEMPKAEGCNNFSHKAIYNNQIWLDGMYMYVPFLARYAKLNNRNDLFNLIKEQYEYIRNHMYDEAKKLYYHGNDTTKSIFWSDKTTGNSSNFWLRSNGWYIVSLVDVLEYYPNGDNKDYLINLLEEAIKGLLDYQENNTKLFYQLIDKGNTIYYVDYSYFEGLNNKNYYYSSYVKNYLESSGSSMIAYTLIKGASLGYLDDKYLNIGLDIFEGIYDYSFKNGSLNNICITAGLGPENKLYRDGSIAYYLAENVGSDDAKGVGPFLMAFIEYSKNKNLIKNN